VNAVQVQDGVAGQWYDTLGRRVEKKDCINSANTRRYYYDKDWRVLDDYDGSGTLKRRYMCGNYIDEVLFSWLAPGATYRYYVHDHLYSPVALVDYVGAVVERYEYDVYGEPNILDGSYTPRSPQVSGYDNTYLFTGRQVDILDGGELKIQYNRNRYYDHYTGRWTTQDPLGMKPQVPIEWRGRVGQGALGANLYEYAKNTPSVLVDPDGLLACECVVYHGPGWGWNGDVDGISPLPPQRWTDSWGNVWENACWKGWKVESWYTQWILAYPESEVFPRDYEGEKCEPDSVIGGAIARGETVSQHEYRPRRCHRVTEIYRKASEIVPVIYRCSREGIWTKTWEGLPTYDLLLSIERKLEVYQKIYGVRKVRSSPGRGYGA